MFRQPTSTRLVVSLRLYLALCAVAFALTSVAYIRFGVTAQNRTPRATPDGPDTWEQPVPHATGNAGAGEVGQENLL